jgi:hypothetical protein
MIDLSHLEDLPPRFIPYGSKSHPMYKQWVKMLDSCTDKSHPLFPKVGGLGITVMHRWFSFPDFVADNEHLYDDEPSTPPILRKAYIRRRNLRAGFNPKNIEWVNKKDATAVQARTVLVDTVYGKNMPLKELARILKERAGEDLPEGAEIFHAWTKVYNEHFDRFDRVYGPVTTIQEIKLQELRRRLREGLPLLAPVREYGSSDRLDDERERALCEALDRTRVPTPSGPPQWAIDRGLV